MGNDNTAFMETLAGCTDAAQDMDLSDKQWYPPNNEYDVLILKVGSEMITPTKGEFKGVEEAVANVTFQILDGEFEDKTFQQSFWIPPQANWGSRPPMDAVNLARLATCIAGHEEKDPATCFGIISAAEGDALRIQIGRGKAKKAPHREYVKLTYLNTLQSTEEVETIEG